MNRSVLGTLVFGILASAGNCGELYAQATKGTAPKTATPRTAQRERPATGGATQSATDRRPQNPPARDAAGANGAAAPSGRAAPAAGNMPAAGNTPAGAKRAAAPPQNLAPKAPFELTEAQQKLLDQILIRWEKESNKIKTFKCNFTRWEYDPAWGPKENDFLKSEGNGEIFYRSPDQGKYRVTDLKEWDSKNYSPKNEGLDHWVCDGKAIFEYESKKKQLIERRLPPELQGKAISDGPLPFIFGAKAEQLKKRYWMRDITPREEVGKKIWLEAVPKFQQDALNFQRATVILNDSDCMPTALQIYLPDGKANTAYAFSSPSANAYIDILNFSALKLTPAMRLSGWKHVVEEDPSEAAKAAPPTASKAPPSAEPSQAKRTAPAAAAPQRK